MGLLLYDLLLPKTTKVIARRELIALTAHKFAPETQELPHRTESEHLRRTSAHFSPFEYRGPPPHNAYSRVGSLPEEEAESTANLRRC